jgi:hypothetical protein
MENAARQLRRIACLKATFRWLEEEGRIEITFPGSERPLTRCSPVFAVLLQERTYLLVAVATMRLFSFPP